MYCVSASPVYPFSFRTGVEYIGKAHHFTCALPSENYLLLKLYLSITIFFYRRLNVVLFSVQSVKYRVFTDTKKSYFAILLRTFFMFIFVLNNQILKIKLRHYSMYSSLCLWLYIRLYISVWRIKYVCGSKPSILLIEYIMT